MQNWVTPNIVALNVGWSKPTLHQPLHWILLHQPASNVVELLVQYAPCTLRVKNRIGWLPLQSAYHMVPPWKYLTCWFKPTLKVWICKVLPLVTNHHNFWRNGHIIKVIINIASYCIKQLQAVNHYSWWSLCLKLSQKVF